MNFLLLICLVLAVSNITPCLSAKHHKPQSNPASLSYSHNENKPAAPGWNLGQQGGHQPHASAPPPPPAPAYSQPHSQDHGPPPPAYSPHPQGQAPPPYSPQGQPGGYSHNEPPPAYAAHQPQQPGPTIINQYQQPAAGGGGPGLLGTALVSN